MRRFAILALPFVLAACASGRSIDITPVASADAFATAETVTVRLDNFGFEPEPLRLEAGRAYAITFVNAAGGGHDFTAPDFFEAASVDADDAAMLAQGQIDVPGGETRIVRLIPAAGRYDLACTHLGHAALGMTGSIIVE